MEPQLYTAATLEHLPWPETPDGLYAKKFLTPLVKEGIPKYIPNIDADLQLLLIDQIVLPLVVVNSHARNAYVCSLHAHYIAYAKQFVESPFIQSLLSLVDKASKYARIDATVYVNNWLFSTDLYPDGLSATHIAAILASLKKAFPHHAVVFRSLNSLTNESLLKETKTLGCHHILSRYVHITRTPNEALFQTRILKSDLRLLQSSSFEISESSDDYASFKSLYSEMCKKQHSHLHPHFTEEFIAHLFQEGLLQAKIVKAQGVIKGIAGYYQRGPLMMCCFFGYDKKDPHHLTIYRLLSTALLLEAQKRGLIFHQSSGAGFYKSLRRAEGFFEYKALYSKHLPFGRRCFWQLLRLFVNAAAPRYLKQN